MSSSANPRIVVFAGPSVDHATVTGLLPEAIVLPPAGQADLVNCIDHHDPRVIALIDGVFDQRLSVWHKEVLYALSRGVHVYGASSMGALRAAETAPFGTVGVGEIHRWYASGTIDHDDEVAVLHADAEHGYRGLSIPLVNVRATLRRAVERGIVEGRVADAIVEQARTVHYTERSVDSILAAARHAALSADELESVETLLRERLVDQKRIDAHELLTELAGLPADLAPFAPSFDFNMSTYFRALLERDRTVVRSGQELSLAEIAYDVALHMPDFDRFNDVAVNRLALLRLADMLEIAVDAEAVELEVSRFRRRHGLVSEADLAAWCSRNDLTAADFRSLMSDQAICRRLRRFAITSNSVRGTSHAIVDALRLEGRYEQWADQTAHRHASAGRDVFAELNQDDDGLATLLMEHAEASGWAADTDIDTWHREAGFRDHDALRVELLRARFARDGE